MLIWPVYPFVASARPLVLGLPQGLAWVLLAMVLMFVSLLALFFGDERERAKGSVQDGTVRDGTVQDGEDRPGG